MAPGETATGGFISKNLKPPPKSGSGLKSKFPLGSKKDLGALGHVVLIFFKG
jgi:hypothetical protein